MDATTSKIAAFYNDNSALEHARLEKNPIEYAVTWKYIERVVESLERVTTKPLRILDIGGGTGRYGKPLNTMPGPSRTNPSE